MTSTTRAALPSLCLSTLLAAAALAGCSGGSAPDPDGVGTGPPVVQPGAPGEPAASGGAVVLPERAAWNEADLAFVRMMVPHHAQALEMTRLARTRASTAPVRALAERIDASQRPEILLMASWLEQQGADLPGAHPSEDDGHDEMSGMPGMTGMLSEAQLADLAAADGRAFDRLFLRGMIAHHEGAVAMAEEVGGTGAALPVSELAADVAAGQAAEVGRMRELLDRS